MIASFTGSMSLSLAESLLHSLWQVTALAALAYLAANTLGGRSAQGRYWIYSATLLAMAGCLPATLFVLGNRESAYLQTAAAPRNTPAHAPRQAAVPAPLDSTAIQTAADLDTTELTSTEVEEGSANASGLGWGQLLWRQLAPYAAVIYLVGVWIMLVRLLTAVWGGQRLRAGAKQMGDRTVDAILRRQAGLLKLRWLPVALYCEQVATPVVVGILKPIILLPLALATSLTTDETEAILTHELAHIRRNDHLFNLLQRILEAVLFFHPAAWYVSRQISIEREHCCDDLVLAVGTRQTTYALSLLRVAELHVEKLRAASITALAADGGRPSRLRERIERLLSGEQSIPRVRLTRAGTCGLVLMLVVILSGTATMLQSSEKPPAEKPPVEVPARNATEPKSRIDKENTPTATNETPQKVAISGRIVLEDGSPATAQGWLYSEGKTALGNGYVKNEDRCSDRFSIKVPVGTVWLKYFADGFAPTGIGPIEAKAEKTVDDLKLVLRPGFSSTLRITSADGKPASGAKLAALAVIGGSSNGPRFDKTTNQQGEFLLEHLAATPYIFLVEAPGHEPLRTNQLTLKPAETTTLSMVRSLLTRGVVLNADGLPAKGAKIRFRCEAINDNGNNGANYGQGNVVATTNDAGQFTLDQLTSTSRYLFIVETADNARTVVGNLRAGQNDVRIQVPKRRDLRVRIVGDLNLLPKSSGKPFIGIRQEISIGEENLAHVDLIGEDTDVTPSDEGGLVEYQGLVPGTVRVTAGDQKQTVNVSETRVTEVVFQLRAQVERPAANARRAPETRGEAVRSDFGRVSDGVGKPVAGATVHFKWGQPDRAVEPASAQTDEQGYFSLPSLAADEKIHMEIEAPGFTTRSETDIFRTVEGVLHPTQRVWEIKRLARLTGKVIGPDGKPLASAPLSMSTNVDYAQNKDTTGSISTGNHLRCATDENGDFSMDVPAGEHFLYFPWSGPTNADMAKFQKLLGASYPAGPVKDVWAGALVKFADGEVPRPVTLDLSKSTARVKGRVIDADGRPVAGLLVSPGLKLSSGGSHRLSTSVATNAQGEYRLDHLPPGNWHLFSGDATRHVEPQAVALRSGEEAVVELRSEIVPDRGDVSKFQVSREKESAIWFHAGDHVRFVLYHRGFLQSGMSKSSWPPSPSWKYQGSIVILNSRKFPVLYDSKDQDTLVLDGKPLDLRQGRVIVLNVEGDVKQMAIDPLRPTESNLPVLGRSIVSAQVEAHSEAVFAPADGAPIQKATPVVQQDATKDAAGAKPAPERKVVAETQDKPAAPTREANPAGAADQNVAAPPAAAQAAAAELAMTITLEDNATDRIMVVLKDSYRRAIKTWDNLAPGKVRLPLPKLESGHYTLVIFANGYAVRYAGITVSKQGAKPSAELVELYRRRYAVLRYVANMQGERELKGPNTKEGRVAISYGGVPDLNGDWLIRQDFDGKGSKSPVFSFHRFGHNGIVIPPAGASFDDIELAPPPGEFQARSIVLEKGMILLNLVVGNEARDRRYAKILVEDITETPPKGIKLIDSVRERAVVPAPVAVKKDDRKAALANGQITVTVSLEDAAKVPVRIELYNGGVARKIAQAWDEKEPGEIQLKLSGLEIDHYALEVRAKGYAPVYSVIRVTEGGIQPAEAKFELYRDRYLILRYAMNVKGERNLTGANVKEGRVAIVSGGVPELIDWGVGQSDGKMKAFVQRVVSNTGFAPAPAGKSFDELDMAPPTDEYTPKGLDFEKGMILFNRVIGHRPQFARYAKLLVEDITETPPKGLEIINFRPK